MANHTQTLREVSKFASGLILGDLIAWLWLFYSGLLPMNFLGFRITPDVAPWGIAFDAVLFLLLIHYGWRAEVHAPSLRQRNFFLIVGVILTVVCVAHVLRLLAGWPVEIGTLMVPYWISWVGIVVAGYLAYASFMFAGGQGKK